MVHEVVGSPLGGDRKFLGKHLLHKICVAISKISTCVKSTQTCIFHIQQKCCVLENTRGLEYGYKFRLTNVQILFLDLCLLQHVQVFISFVVTDLSWVWYPISGTSFLTKLSMIYVPLVSKMDYWLFLSSEGLGEYNSMIAFFPKIGFVSPKFKIASWEKSINLLIFLLKFQIICKSSGLE